MSILVTGAKGVVGSYFRELASTFSAPLTYWDLEELDVTDLDRCRAAIVDGPFRTVIHLAAATDVDRCEQQPEWAYRLNAIGARNVAIACREQDAELVQVSTTQIFGGDGREGPFSEMDLPAPVNVYAKSKLAGEDLARAQVAKLYLVRTAWIMGGGKADTKFVGKVAAKVRAGEPIKAVNDEHGSPTYARDLVECIRELLVRRAYGTYHVTNQGAASRYDMAVEMKRILGSTSTITPVSAASFALPAPRPKSDVSVSYALPAVGLGEVMPTWQAALERYLRSWMG
jgi:dTDP-4-dehydrorhamnose reductase